MASTINSPDSLNIQTNTVNAISIDASQNVTFAGTITGDGSGLSGLPAGYTDADALSLLNASGTAPVYAARAWVNFNGEGTVAIRASGNVSSITDNGTGNYTVNFTNAMPDANYSVSDSIGGSGTSVSDSAGGAYDYLVGSFKINIRNGANAQVNRGVISVAVFR